MQDVANSFNTSMTTLPKAEWYAALGRHVERGGFFEHLDNDHAAIYTPGGQAGSKTLIVTFENRQGIQAMSELGQPLGFEVARATEWAHLGMICEGDTWFRSAAVYELFEVLEDDGFFDDFERVVFYGAGPCGYAAAAFARAAQDAVVVALQPQATLDPRVASWDDRFTERRRMNFSGSFGYAPEFIELTERTFVIYDPRETFDAMHAALFIGPHTTLLRTPFLGSGLQGALLDMALLYRVLARAGSGKLTEKWFYQMMRARRSYAPYLRNLMAELDREARPDLLRALCQNVTARMKAPRFERKLMELEQG